MNSRHQREVDHDPRDVKIQASSVLIQTIKRRKAFIAERIAVPLGTNKNRRKQMAGTNLVQNKVDEKTRKGLDISRAKEWMKSMDFNAVVQVQGKILDELLQEGHKPIPGQWIEADKKAHLKRPGQEQLH